MRRSATPFSAIIAVSLIGLALDAPHPVQADSLRTSLVIASDDEPRGETPQGGTVAMYAVAAGTARFEASVDVPKQPLEAPGAYTDIAALGNVVVAASQTAGLQLFEVLADGKLALRSTTRAGVAPATVMSVALVESQAGALFAYVGWGLTRSQDGGFGFGGGIDVYEVSPRSVVRVHRITDIGQVGALTVHGSRLYAGWMMSGCFPCFPMLGVYDIATPQRPRLLGQGRTDNGGGDVGGAELPLDIAIAGTFALVADGLDVQVISIGNGNGNPAPFVVRSTPGEAMAVAAVDGRFYIADGSNGFIAGSLSALIAAHTTDSLFHAAPTRSSSIARTFGAAVDVVIDERTQRAYVASEQDGVEVFDVTQTTPVWRETVTLGGFAHALTLFQRPAALIPPTATQWPTATPWPTATWTAPPPPPPPTDRPTPPPTHVPTTEPTREPVFPRSSSVVLLPGTIGSELDNSPRSGCRDRPSGRLWPPWGDDLSSGIQDLLHIKELFGWRLKALELDSSGMLPANSCDIIRATRVIERPLPGMDPYMEPLADRLRAAGLSVSTCPYDWRHSVDREALGRLRQCVEQAASVSADGRVALVGHSMGGLLATWYVSDPQRARSVSQIVTVGTPFLGAPLMIEQLLTGLTGIEFLDDFTANPLAAPLVNRGLIQRIYRNSLGFMTLLPSGEYETMIGPALFRHDAILDPFGSPKPLTGATFVAFLASRGAVPSLIESGRTTHAEIAAAQRAAEVPISLLAADHHADTVAALTIAHSGPTKREILSPAFTPGDGTVPLGSALAIGVSVDTARVRRCSYGAAAVSAGVRHDALLRAPAIMADIERLMRGALPTGCQSVTSDVAQFERSAGLSSLGDRDLLQVEVHGHVQLYAVDDSTGQATGRAPDGTWRADLAGVQIRSDEGHAMLTSVEDRPLRIHVDPWPSTEAWQVRVAIHRAAATTQASTAVDGVLYLIPATMRSGPLTIEIPDPSSLDNIRLTAFRGGAVDPITVPPTARVRGADAQDVTPPVVAISADGPRDASGQVVGAATIRVDAQDAASGVASIMISPNNGRTWRPYEAAFVVDAGVVAAVQSYAVDRAGNNSAVSEIVLRRGANLYLPTVMRGDASIGPVAQECSAEAQHPITTFAAALQLPSLCPDRDVTYTLADGEDAHFVVLDAKGEGVLSFLARHVDAEPRLEISLLDDKGQGLTAAVERIDGVSHLGRWVTPGRYAVHVQRAAGREPIRYQAQWSLAQP